MKKFTLSHKQTRGQVKSILIRQMCQNKNSYVDETHLQNCNSHPKTFVFQTIRFTLKLPKAVNGRIKRP